MTLRLLFKLLCLAGMLFSMAVGQAAPPPAGTVITNTGTGSYVDSATGLSVRLTSNTVITTVSALEALTLTSGQNLLIATGAQFAISHTLTNTGNVLTSYALNLVVAPGSGFTPVNLQMVQDVNGNGRADLGEPVFAAGSTISLAPGVSAALLIVGQVPAGASLGQTAQVVLSATSTVQGATASNTDNLSVTNGAVVQVTLAASTATAAPGVPFSLTATAVNSGSAAAGPIAVTVNGTAASLLVLRIPVPSNTSFVSSQPSTSAGAQTLYHLVGSPPNTYVTVLPPGAVVDAVAWSLPSLSSGGNLQGQFSVQPNANAAGTLTSTAFVDWIELGANYVTTSNPVQLTLPSRPATINFYPPTGYATPATQSSPGSPLFVQIDAAVCNADPLVIGTVPVTLVSQLTGDIETFIATETGPNTGLYRILPNVPTASGVGIVVSAGNGVLEVLRNDLITATISLCGSVTVTATTSLLIDPSGVVYDSRTNLPVAGTTVRLIDVAGAGNGGNPGGPAVVFLADGSASSPNAVVTGADGSFAFPLVAPSTYVLRITTPSGYTFPSILPLALQPAGRIINAQGSYGNSFSAGVVSNVPVRFDVPLDSGGPGSIFIQKTANKAIAEVGDFVDYSVQLNNVSVSPLLSTVVSDTLPAGFVYVRGTARFNGALLPDPLGGAGPQLQFALGSIAAGGQPILSYRVRIGVGSASGTGTNSAQAQSGTTRSNLATVRVRIIGGVFSEKAYVIGKVFADCSRNGVQDLGESGIPGVRIYLEDGTYVVTDEEGKYSFYGLTPRTHVAKLDNTTLPAGASLAVLNNRNARDAGSQFVDLTQGEFRKVDFAINECGPAIDEQITARRRALTNPSEILQAANTLLSASPTATAIDARTLPSSGALGLPGALQNGSGAAGLGRLTAPGAATNGAANSVQGLPGLPAGPGALAGGSAGASTLPVNANRLGAVGDVGGPFAPNAQGLPRPIFTPSMPLPESATAPTPVSAPAAVADLEDLLPSLDSQVGFIDLQAGQVMTAGQTRVRVKGPLGTQFALVVNGEAVPASQVGKKSRLERTGTVAWEYIGVNLKPGSNRIEVSAIDSFGVARGNAQVVVKAPGQLAKIRIDVADKPIADGATAVSVGINLQDVQGLPISARTQVTLQASLGQWQTPDLDSRQPGTQVFVEGGESRFLLLAPAQPGSADIAALSGDIKAAVKVEFLPNLRPMIAAGIIEGTINLRNLNPAALQPAQSGDVFERQIQSVSRSVNGGKGSAAARTAFFLKGKVLGSTLLTLAYDSDKAADTALFRDIQPDEFYPVYGDSSARGFDAQSTSRLYMMLQNGTNYVLLGDFSTLSDNPARQLTQYSRALNGIKGRLQRGALTVEGFASRTSSTQIIQEFRANGTSGPFRLNFNGVINSQQVNIITRSRNQPSVIINDTPLAQFTDYQLEAFSGQLLLKNPVSSVDSDLNPILIRVSYAVDAGGPKHSVAGAEARFDVTPNMTVGAVAIRDTDPLNNQTLAGGNLTVKLGEKTVATAEVARSMTDLQGSGSGQRVEIKHEDGRVQARAWGARTDAGFYNPNSIQSAGQSEYGLKASALIDENNRVVAEGLKSSNSVTGAAQTALELKLEHNFGGNIKLETGLRYSSANAYSVLSTLPLPGSSTSVLLPAISGLAAPAEQVSYTSARVKLSVPVPNFPQAEVFGLAEYAIDGSGGKEVGIGGNYAINPTTRAYFRHNFINSLNGPATLNPQLSQYSTVAGINTELSDSTQVFNEYRMGTSINGRNSEAAVGLRRLWRLPNDIGVSASLQRIKPISGVTLDDSMAIALGIDYTAAENWKASSQLQWQTSKTSQSWLASAAIVNKLDTEWTMLNRALYSVQTNLSAGGGSRDLITAQSGFAYRPVGTDVWNALGRIQYKREADNTFANGLNVNQSSWIFSTHANVQPSRSWLVTGRYAAKAARDESNGLLSRSVTQLLGARLTWDVTNDWEVGVQAYRTWGNGSAETAMGAEVGYVLWKNLWMSVGYNVKGFRAPDLAGEAYTQKGLYLRLRFKFDENLL